MIDYKISLNDVVTSGGDFSLVSGRDATRQRIEQKLRLWKGENFLFKKSGFPWLPEVLGENVRPEVLRTLVQGVVVGDPEVKGIISFNVDYDRVKRVLTVRFRARFADGEAGEMEVMA